MEQVGTVQRAFEIAKGGHCRTMEDLRQQLKRERYSNIGEHLSGPSIKRQLMTLMAQRLG